MKGMFGVIVCSCPFRAFFLTAMQTYGFAAGYC